MSSIWKEQFKVRAYEVGRDAALTMQFVCNYLQEIAGNHAYELGVAVDHLLKNNITWILSRLHVQMVRYPYWRETVTIKTWPAQVDRLYAIRDFELFDGRERPVGKATSSWMLMDIKSRKPIPITDSIQQIHLNSPGRAIDDVFEKLPVMQEAQNEKLFHVRLSDLDVNQHVNNVNYIEWGLETVPEEIYKFYFLADMEITFRAESNFGDQVVSQSESHKVKDHQIFIHQLTREKDKRELARLRTHWKLKDQEALK
jgi:medium-chain acyl-[acyl-carrier-protein] hydrolase